MPSLAGSRQRARNNSSCFPEMEEERDAADKSNASAPILVVLGNPPYNGFAGVASGGRAGLVDAYRTTKVCAQAARARIERPVCPLLPYGRAPHHSSGRAAGHRLLHLELFLARWLYRITGCGSDSWKISIDVWIDCLNGDKYKTGKLTPEGEAGSQRVFSTPHNREGIQVGTAIALLFTEPIDRRGTRSFRHCGEKRNVKTAGYDRQSGMEKV